MSNCATNIHVSPATNPAPAATDGSIKRSSSHTGNHVVSHPLDKYHYWRKGHKKMKKNRHWNEKAISAQMGVDSNSEVVDSNSKRVDSNAKRVDSNANSQPLLNLPLFDYRLGLCGMYQFLRDPATADERLSWKNKSPSTIHFPLTSIRANSL